MTLFREHWSRKIVGDLNDYHIKLAKFQGDFVWQLEVGKGEFIIIPAGVEHCPYFKVEVQVLLCEKAGTVNTGSAEGDEKTVKNME